MEYIIKIRDLDSEKLNFLKNILENNQSINIVNNSKDEIKIVYDCKKIKLNEKFNNRIELIRNKYYRQLLNLINYKEKIKAYVSDFDFVFYSPRESRTLLKMALINYIGVYNFDNIFELTKDEMLELKDYMRMNSDSEYITRLLGLYVPNKCKEQVIKELEPKLYGGRLDKIKECKNFILICPEIIQEFCIENYRKIEKYGIEDIFELYTIIFNKVLVHEIGHGVFEYINDADNESRANYFTSLTFDGTFDEIIKIMTDIQKGSYKNPKLIDDCIEDIVEKVYKIK